MIASRKSLLTAVLAAAALAAGCSDDGSGLSDEEYADAIRPILVNFGDESQRLADELGASSSADAAAPFVKELATVTETTIDDLEDVDPPDDATGGHQALVGALDGYLAAVNELVRVVKSGDNTEIQRAGEEFVRAAQVTLGKLEDARKQLEDAGVPVGEEIASEIPAG